MYRLPVAIESAGVMRDVQGSRCGGHCGLSSRTLRKYLQRRTNSWWAPLCWWRLWCNRVPQPAPWCYPLPLPGTTSAQVRLISAAAFILLFLLPAPSMSVLRLSGIGRGHSNATFSHVMKNRQLVSLHLHVTSNQYQLEIKRSFKAM